MKITIIGAGNVGATTTQRIVDKGLAREIVLLDIVDGIPHGKSLDIIESTPIIKNDVFVKGTTQYQDTRESDIIIITAGIARKPGMSRDDLQNTNAAIVRSATEQAVHYSPNSIIIVVTNPLDVMTFVALKASGFPRERVIGMAGILDSARFRTFIALECGVSIEDVTALVLGGHGDSMVPLPRYSTIAGVPLPELLDQRTIEKLIQRTRDGGIEIVNYLQTGSAYYAPSAAVVEMVEAIVKDKKRILPCAVFLKGEYNLTDTVIGIPVKIGRTGIEKIMEINLLPNELEALHISANEVKKNIEKLSL
ncbi:MAG: malate dehydrogenase [Bacteroidetes bacterium]|nr:malate dehydrogenase [Bacteroidota bacterium]